MAFSLSFLVPAVYQYGIEALYIGAPELRLYSRFSGVEDTARPEDARPRSRCERFAAVVPPNNAT